MLGYFLLRPPAILFGIADQAFDFSHRRAKIQGEKERLNPFDPRSRSGMMRADKMRRRRMPARLGRHFYPSFFIRLHSYFSIHAFSFIRLQKEDF